jgi:hypothetical protein
MLVATSPSIYSQVISGLFMTPVECCTVEFKFRLKCGLVGSELVIGVIRPLVLYV